MRQVRRSSHVGRLSLVDGATSAIAMRLIGGKDMVTLISVYYLLANICYMSCKNCTAASIFLDQKVEPEFQSFYALLPAQGAFLLRHLQFFHRNS